jgi:hypothetical protein
MTSSQFRFIKKTAFGIGIFFACFLSVFSLDAFHEGSNFWNSVGAVGIHLIPSAMILVSLFLSRYRYWIAAVAFLILSLAYIYWAWARFPISVYVIIAGPMLLISLLFAICHYSKVN